MTTHKPKLTARRVETAPAGTYDDGRGLRLIVRPSGARSWIVRYQLNGKRRDMGLGRWPRRRWRWRGTGRLRSAGKWTRPAATR